MKLIIDLGQSPVSLRKDLDEAVRFALGGNYYIEQAEGGNFTREELADPKVNLPTVSNTPALAALPPVVVSQPAVSEQAAALPGAAQAAAVELDSEGLPYDVRIHSAGKSKIANGTWKLKKGVDKALVEQINAQNKALLGNPLPSTPPPSNVVPLQGLPALPTLAALPELPPVAQVAGPEVEIVVTDYPTMAQFVAQQIKAKPNATKQKLDQGLTHYGLVDTNGAPDLTALAHRPDVVAPLYQWLKAVIALTEE